MLPAWIVKRARDLQAQRVVEILAPVTPRGQAVYLVVGDGHMELHAVDDAASGIDGCTIPLTQREGAKLLLNLAAALSGRVAGVSVADEVAP